MRGAGYEALVHKRFALSAWKSMKACMRREVILVYRHSFVYAFRIAQVCSSCPPVSTTIPTPPLHSMSLSAILPPYFSAVIDTLAGEMYV